MSVASLAGEKRIFSLQEAQDLLPVVRKLTTDAIDRVTDLLEQMEDLPEDDPEFEEARSSMEGVVQAWSDQLGKLGCEIQGLWLVDFDNGEGYYCWSYPEDSVDHFHGYDEGFAGRTRIC